MTRMTGAGIAVLVALALGAAIAQETPPAESEEPAPGNREAGEPEDFAADLPGWPEPTTAPADSGAGQGVSTPKQPSPEDIIRQFQQQRPEAVPLLPTGTPDETATRAELADIPGGRRPARLPDGAMLVDRTGRLVKEGHWWVFVFESDSESYPEPPMKLLPNQALERMVRESRGGLDPVIFIVTGEVTDFKGENYVLVRKVLRKRDLGNLRK